ncbi:MAG: transporter [Burkholderiales bacterium]|nr:transporter [Burkholderiales bacterium]MDE1927264.1 transporter [Burkholderiales bacterium]MDE2157696.1 transporter [Burkholderiales bacterium]MDE2503549.1 transporter [Burkholderiales bacterium]
MAAVAALALSPAAAQACATCGCSLASDAATGYASAAGWRASLQFDFIDQNQLRHGSHAIAPSEVAALNPDLGQEVEKRTTNRYTTLGIAYGAAADWGFKILVPYLDRGHQTYGASADPLVPDAVSDASIRGLGDIKLIASYQGLLPTHDLGLQIGLKLPTGAYGGGPGAGGQNVGHGYADFASGPNQGAPVDTSLQPGTGSTDLIVGAYYYRAVSQDFDAFVDGLWQGAVAHRLDRPGADFRPGNNTTLSFGLRWEADPAWTPQLQVNLTRKQADRGDLADGADTAGTVAYLSPGVTLRTIADLSLFGFVQWPLHSRLAGYQLFPHWTATFGASASF